MHVFELLVEAGVPRQNPCRHRENMQAPYRTEKTGFKPRNLFLWNFFCEAGRSFHDWPQRVFIVLSCTLNGGEVWCCGACMKTATSGCFCLYMSEYITEINIKLHDFHLCVFLSRAFLFNKVIKWKFSFLSAGVEGTLELDWVVLIPGI